MTKHGVDVYPHVAGWDTQPVDDHIAQAASIVSSLTNSELTEFARQLVAENATQCDRLIDACIDAFEMQPQRQRATELSAVVEVERRRHFVLELQKAINAVIDGALRRT